MWQAQIHALICQKATVHFYSKNLTKKQIRNGFMEPSADIGATVQRLTDGGAARRICVLPEGPMTIPYIGGTGAAPTATC